jgi:hypothetical protein
MIGVSMVMKTTNAAAPATTTGSRMLTVLAHDVIPQSTRMKSVVVVEPLKVLALAQVVTAILLGQVPRANNVHDKIVTARMVVLLTRILVPAFVLANGQVPHAQLALLVLLFVVQEALLTPTLVRAHVL